MEVLTKDALVGAWALLSFTETNSTTGVESFPMGPDPQGILLYTADGYMSAQLCTTSRDGFRSNDMYLGTGAEYMASGKTYLAYSGPYHFDERTGVLEHEMAVSFFPNWAGQRQVRSASLYEDLLYLATVTPMSFNGSMKTAQLVWRRISSGQ
ncbi:lipocalin-like domain-containing protein [Pseudomonas fluorescens]|uniref:lipocalin-like domain-containing protein n=1 Tax=Pseudomonas fluorescens TaxID=294 RepID=UPI001BE830B3|nr:lipocalin-like domain-containing protein [Pseudomonas fluorescens]MBT2373064.1 lipocalin-like domain-containing protein [Pseudomonas fluorescens]